MQGIGIAQANPLDTHVSLVWLHRTYRPLIATPSPDGPLVGMLGIPVSPSAESDFRVRVH